MKRLPLHLVAPLLVTVCVLITHARAAGPTRVGHRRSPGKPESEAARMQAKLREIVIPRISFEEANVVDVIRHLVKLSREHDPEGKGINIVLLHGPRTGAAGAKAARAPQNDDGFRFVLPGPAANGASGPPGSAGEEVRGAAQPKTE